MTKTIIGEPLRAAGVGLLRAVNLWSGRHYRRAVMRRELRRIGRGIVAERKAREQAGKLKSGERKAEARGLGVVRSERSKGQAT